MGQVIVKSRAVAAYIELMTGLESTPSDTGFYLPADEKGRKCVSGKSLWKWEREFNDSPFAKFNQRLRILGDEQRELTNLLKQGA